MLLASTSVRTFVFLASAMFLASACTRDTLVGSDAPVSLDLGADMNSLDASDASDASDAGDSGTETTVAQSAYIKASNTDPDDRFGFALALSGDGQTLAVGAFSEDGGGSGIGADESSNTEPDCGAVYVYRLVSGVWSQEAYIKSVGGIASNQFGRAVSLSSNGDVLAVGAIGEDGGGGAVSDSGFVYVYGRTGSTWVNIAFMSASNLGTGDNFGSVVMLSGDGNTLVVGAPGEDSGNGIQNDESAESAGAAYVFSVVGGNWGQRAYLKAPAPTFLDFFGASVALSGDGQTLVVGAPGERSSAVNIDGDDSLTDAIDSGAAYVFARSGETWSLSTYVKAFNTGADDGFGRSVAISSDGNVLAVGAAREASASTGIGGDGTNNDAPDSGAVYVLRRNAGVWSHEAYVKPPVSALNIAFGGSVALSSDGAMLFVGAPGDDSRAIGVGGSPSDLGTPDSGAVLVYEYAGAPSARWSQLAYVKASNSRAFAEFGTSVAASSDGAVFAVSAPLESSAATGVGGAENNDSAPNAGAAYVFR